MDVELLKQAVQLTHDFDDEDVQPVVDAQGISALTDLLEAIGARDTISSRDYDALFGSNDPLEIGVDAIRILASCNAVSAIAKIVDFVELIFLRQDDDDYLCDYIPGALQEFDLEGIEALLEYAITRGQNEDARCVFLQAVEQWCKSQATMPSSIAALVSQGLSRAAENPVCFNADLMWLAVDWKLTGLSELIERAFSLDRIDCGVAGDWHRIKQLLGVSGLGLPMPDKPYNSMLDFRRKIGIGIFSSQPLFKFGELQEKAASQYLVNAMVAFRSSDEGRHLERKGQPIDIVESFLGIGLEYLFVTIDEMTADDAREILLEWFPRKVSMAPESSKAASEAFCAFCSFVDRVHRVESAKAIVKEIRRISAQFRREMSNPRNFGMADSIVIAAQAEGVDITNEEEMQRFFMLQNARGATSREARNASREVGTRIDLPVQRKAKPMSLKERKKLLAKKMRKK